ncbi:MAG: serine hydrolase domain-containing protein [Acidobacteriota bacterium]
MAAPSAPFQVARHIIAKAIASRVYPAAVVEVGTSDAVVWTEAFGAFTYDAGAPRATLETVFDLASLTKVVATASVAMRLVETGAVRLDAPVGTWVSGWNSEALRAITLRDLLGHCAGLPEWAPLSNTCANRAEALTAISRCERAYAPRFTSRYSDLGFIVLGAALEAAGRAPLDVSWERIAVQLRPASGPFDLMFRPPDQWCDRIAPTRVDAGRGYPLVGEVDDDNAHLLGDVAGHAGLFGTAGALGRFARAVMTSLQGEAGVLARPDTMRTFVTPTTILGSSRALAWDTMRPTSSCGDRMSPAAFGHTGFTGTSLWIDPQRQLYVVLLTNRVHPHAGPAEPIQQVRRAVHDAVIDAWNVR